MTEVTDTSNATHELVRERYAQAALAVLDQGTQASCCGGGDGSAGSCCNGVSCTDPSHDSAGVTFYTDNDEFLASQTREQDPLYSLQAHVIYSFPFGIWAALDGTYYAGGRTTVDGARRDDRQENTRLGATVSFPVDQHNSVKVYASTGVTARTGSDFTTVGFAWQVRWGGGL